MAVEYNGNKIVLRDTAGTQMSLPRFFQLALVSGDGSHVAKPTSGLYRNDSSEFHGGWDMGTSGATDVPVRTPAGGTVVYKGEASGFGPNLVIVKEDDYERYHYFGHMASASVEQGDTVQQGDAVGIIGGYGGSSGNWNPSAYAIHLHYEIMTKNFKVSGGTSGDKEDVLDPMDVFDEATLPSGWLFGYNPQTKPTSYAAKDGINNWDYIELDKDAVDFGPSGGAVASEPFFTDKKCYDISHPQRADIIKCIDCIIADGGGGIIFGGGRITNNGFTDWAQSYPEYEADKAMLYAKDKIPIGVYFYNYADFGSDTTKAVSDALAYLTNAGFKPEDFKLGVWLDIDSEGTAGGDPYLDSNADTNMINVKTFIDTFNNAGYVTAGIYTTARVLSSDKFNCSYSHDIPIWCAAIGNGHLSFEEAGNDWLTPNYPKTADYSKLYMHQFSWVQHVSNWSGDLCGDKICQPIPVPGSGGGGGGGGGSYTEVIDVTVEVVPPKRIYFSPVPGLIETEDSRLDKRTQEITISTDADGADLYYTIDGSSPYQYKVVGETVVYELSSSAIHYEQPIKIFKDTHIRVVAVSFGATSTFDEPLAKGSGTFLFKYQDLVHDWESEKKAYAISDNNASFFEENKQAFLRLHATKTSEEILYADVYKHDKEIENEDAEDNATSSEGTPAGSEEL